MFSGLLRGNDGHKEKCVSWRMDYIVRYIRGKLCML